MQTVKRKKKQKFTVTRATTVAAIVTMISQPLVAEPTAGFGLSLSFDGSGVHTGIGVRVFSDNEQDSVVGSVGIDFMLGHKSWRSTVGASYLGEDSYVGLDLGINIQNGELDIGISTGLAELEQPTRDTVVAEAVSNSEEIQPPLEISNSFSDSPTGPFYDFAPEPTVFPVPPNANYDFVLERERAPFPWENNFQFPDF